MSDFEEVYCDSDPSCSQSGEIKLTPLTIFPLLLYRGLMEFIQLGEPIVETNKKFFRSFIKLSEILQD